MRGLRNIALGLLTAALLSGATVSAQKGKPAPTTTRWTLQIVSANDATTPTIVAGTGNPLEGEVRYDPAQSTEVSVNALPPDRSNAWNRFSLSLKNADPYAPKDISSTAPWRWLSFRNVAFAANASAFTTRGGYTDNANWLAPAVKDSGYSWPFDIDAVNPNGPPEYQAAFMNERPHPLQFYEEMTLSVAFQGSSFLDMRDGESRAVAASTGIAIWSKRDCRVPQARGIGIAIAHPLDAVDATVSRQGNEWTIQVNQAVKLLEFGYAVPVSQRTPKSCEMYLAGGWWTTPLSYTLVFTKAD